MPRRQVRASRGFDATLGFPGEGPQRAIDAMFASAQGSAALPRPRCQPMAQRQKLPEQVPCPACGSTSA
eukprot:7885395-Lingulodinium_polyedra.AAC.1